MFAGRAHLRRRLRPQAELIANPGPPGKYYPFKPPIKPESPLGKLLDSKGHDYSAMK